MPKTREEMNWNEMKEAEAKKQRDDLIVVGSVILAGAGVVAVVGIAPIMCLYYGLKIAVAAKDAVVDWANAEPPPPAPYRFNQRDADVAYARREYRGGFDFEEAMEKVRRKHGY